jgi:hypothetical protein
MEMREVARWTLTSSLITAIVDHPCGLHLCSRTASPSFDWSDISAFQWLRSELALPSGTELSNLLKALLLRLANNPPTEMFEEIRHLANRRPEDE